MTRCCSAMSSGITGTNRERTSIKATATAKPANWRLKARRLCNITKSSAHQRLRANPGVGRLNGRSLGVAPARNTEAVKDYPRGVRTIECVEVNACNVVIQKIVTLFQGEVNTNALDHFRVVFASLHGA